MDFVSSRAAAAAAAADGPLSDVVSPEARSAEAAWEEPTLDDDAFDRLRQEKQREVDLLTLELLSNKRQFRKLTAKTSIDEAEETCRFFKYKSRVVKLFLQLLKTYEEEHYAHLHKPDVAAGDDAAERRAFPRELTEMFRAFLHKSIQSLEWHDWNRQNDRGRGDDTLFSSLSAEDREEEGEIEGDKDEENGRQGAVAASCAPLDSDADLFSVWGNMRVNRRG
jgi:hypothetical protein